VRKTMLKS